eukprot:SAG31_NODE_12392_length_945_cov_1.329787_2_plen_112_part_01
MVKLLRLVRMLKLLRLVRIKRILARWEEDLYSVSALKMGKIFFVIFSSAHWISCLWYYMGNDAYDGTDGSEVRYGPDGEIMRGWVRKAFQPHLVGNETVIDTGSHYFRSFFW